MLCTQAISVSAHGFYNGGVEPGGGKLVAQAFDVGVDRLRLRDVLPAPGFAQQVFARDDLARVLHKGGEQFEFARGQVDGAVSPVAVWRSSSSVIPDAVSAVDSC